MASLLYVLQHSTEEPDRAATGLFAAAAAARAGHDVALWLSGEGVRLGVDGVVETLREPLPETALASWDALIAADGQAYLDRASYERRQYADDAVRTGAQVVGAERLAELLAEGRAAVTL